MIKKINNINLMSTEVSVSGLLDDIKLTISVKSKSDFDSSHFQAIYKTLFFNSVFSDKLKSFLLNEVCRDFANCETDLNWTINNNNNKGE